MSILPVVAHGKNIIYVDDEKFVFHWTIAKNYSMGFYCAYVGIPESLTIGMFRKLKNHIDELYVHGFLTYNENLDYNITTTMDEETVIVIGWDYGHYDDQSISNPGGDPHSIDEIRKECEYAISQIEEILNY